MLPQLLLISRSPAAAAYPTGFLCRDQNPQCAQWKRNIERHGWPNCQGPDHEHMLHNCAETCNLCEEAKSRWKQTPEGQQYVDVEPYAALGVSVSASSRAIKKAYRKISLKYHPDKTRGDADSTRRFKEAAAALNSLVIRTSGSCMTHSRSGSSRVGGSTSKQFRRGHPWGSSRRFVRQRQRDHRQRP